MPYDEKMVAHLAGSLRRGDPGAVDASLSYLVNEVDDEFSRCQYLAALIPHLPATAFDAVMAVLQDCPGRYRSDAFVALARHAPADQLTRLLDCAAEVEWMSPPPEAQPQPWLRLMHELDLRLDELEEEDRVLAVGSALALPSVQSAEAIEVLARHLSVESVRQALRAVDAWEVDAWEGARHHKMIMIGALAARLPREEGRDVVGRYVDINLRLTSEPEFAAAEELAPVAAYLHDDTVRMTLRSVCRQISLASDQATKMKPSLERMAPLVREKELMPEVFDRMLNPGVWRPASRLVVLSVLAPYLSNDDLRDAMTRLLPGLVEVESFAALVTLGQVLPDGGQERSKIASRALDLARRIGNDRQQVKAITALAPILPEDLAVQVLKFLGPMTRLVPFPTVIFDALDALAPQLPCTALPQALTILMDTPPTVEAGDIHTVTRLVERLCRDDQTHAIRRLFQSYAYPERSRLWGIAPFLSAPLAQQALTLVRELPDMPDHTRRVSLAALVPRLPVGQRDEVASEVLGLLDVAPDVMRIRLAVLARLAEATTLEEVMTACQRAVAGLRRVDLSDQDGSWQAFIDLIRHLPDDVIGTAVVVSGRMHFLDDRCRILTALAPRLPKRVVPELVAELEDAPEGSRYDEGYRARALVALALESEEDERQRCLTALLDRLARRSLWSVAQSALITMIPLLAPQSRSRAVEAALRNCFGSYQFADPAALVNILDDTGLQMALGELDKIGDSHRRACATAAILRRAGMLTTDSRMLPEIDVPATWRQASTRADLFELVGASAWWIHRQGGSRAVTMITDAIFDVCRG